jgi:hypothetical protein
MVAGYFRGYLLLLKVVYERVRADMDHEAATREEIEQDIIRE